MCTPTPNAHNVAYLLDNTTAAWFAEDQEGGCTSRWHMQLNTVQMIEKTLAMSSASFQSSPAAPVYVTMGTPARVAVADCTTNLAASSSHDALDIVRAIKLALLASVPSDLQQLVCQEAGIAVTVLTWWDENEEDASLSAMQHLRSLTTTGNVLNARRIIETAFPAAKERWQYLEPLQEALLADMQQAQRALITTSSDSTTQPTTNKCIPRRPLLRTRALLGNGAACRDESLDSYGHLSADGCMRTWIPSYANTTPRVGGQVQEGRNWYLYVSTATQWKPILTMRMGRCSIAANIACAVRGAGQLTLLQSASQPGQLKVTWQPVVSENDGQHVPLDMFGGGGDMHHSKASTVEMRCDAARVVFEDHDPDGRVVIISNGRQRLLFWVQEQGVTHIAGKLQEAVQQAVGEEEEEEEEEDQQASTQHGVRIGPLPSSLLRVFLDATAQARGEVKDVGDEEVVGEVAGREQE